MKMLILSAAMLLAATATANAQDFTQARQLFADYQKLELSYDPQVAELYCDVAFVSNTRRYPNGDVKTLRLNAPQYKHLVRTAMPLAKSRGDSNKYSDVKYVAEGANTRITATRYSVLKKYSSPISILVGKCGDKALRILEEKGESRP